MAEGNSPQPIYSLRPKSAMQHMMTRFRILGPLEVEGPDGPLALGGQKQRALLAVLLLNLGRVVATDSVIDKLWGEDPPRTAATSLQNLVSQLRKLLGADAVETRPPGYALHAEPDDLDLGHHAALIGELEALVAEYPLRERIRGQLMLALYRSGRQAEALKAYHDGRRALVDELGIEPSPELQQLQAAILRQEGGLEPATRSGASRDDHYAEIVRAIAAGRLVPVLGPAASAAGLPPLAEVAAHLAKLFKTPAEHDGELTRVSQHVALTQGVGPLYDELHELLGGEFEPGPIHRFFADLAGVLRARGEPQPLLVTTAFDHALERAFADAGEDVDVLTYLSVGRHRGKFLHVRPDRSMRVVEVPNEYADVAPGERPVILKVHGQVDAAPEREWESFVVSEDDYIDYLARTDLSNVVPVLVAAKLRRSHFLFLGYALQQWSLRVFLHRVWGDEKVAYRSWAVQPGAGTLDREYWRQRGIDVFDLELDDYVESLGARIESAAERVAV